VVRYVLIRQQKTMLAEADGSITSYIRRLAAVLAGAGFPTAVSRDAEGWLIAHAAFVAPIAFALYRVGVDPKRLASDTRTLRLMVRATRQAFQALQACGNSQIPRHLRALYLYAPERLAVAYWRRIMASDSGELWFAGHTRAAPQEMTSLAVAVRDAVARSRRPTPDLAALLRLG
jgi:2-dehydropantoate 2-reductase